MKIINKKEFQTLLTLPIMAYVGFFLAYLLLSFSDFVWVHSMEKYISTLADFLLSILPVVLYTYLIFAILGMPIYIFLKKSNWLNFTIFWLFSQFPAFLSSIIAFYFSAHYGAAPGSLIVAAAGSFIMYQIYIFIYWFKSDDRTFSQL